MSWIVCQIGAREHYAVPRALLHVGCLHTLYTDIWANSAIRGLGRFAGRRGRSLSSRYHPGIPTRMVNHWTANAMARRLRGGIEAGSDYEGFIEEGSWFSQKIRDRLSRGEVSPCTLFSYDTSAQELFQWAKPEGFCLVLDQMDPGRIEAELLAEEREKWPGWEPAAGRAPEAYHERRSAEWELADKIIINSDWSRNALIQQGVPQEKLVVLPLVYEADTGIPNRKNLQSERSGPLRALFLGQVNLRKGVPYLFEAARLLGSAVEVTIVGPVQVSQLAIDSAPSNVRFTGAVSRSDVASYYQNADVFVLPTLSDGFAITQLEAMAYGLPVIATPHCGKVVTGGEDGLIVPARDGAALAAAIEKLGANREDVRAMSEKALAKSRQFSVERLARELKGLAFHGNG